MVVEYQHKDVGSRKNTNLLALIAVQVWEAWAGLIWSWHRKLRRPNFQRCGSSESTCMSIDLLLALAFSPNMFEHSNEVYNYGGEAAHKTRPDRAEASYKREESHMSKLLDVQNRGCTWNASCRPRTLMDFKTWSSPCFDSTELQNHLRNKRQLMVLPLNSHENMWWHVPRTARLRPWGEGGGRGHGLKPLCTIMGLYDRVNNWGA